MSYAISSMSGASSAAPVNMVGSAKPPKYSGGKINPDWIKWNEMQNKAKGSNAPGTTVPNPAQALPVVCSMEEKFELQTDTGKEVNFTPKLEETFQNIQNPNYAAHVGLDSDDIIDELGTVMAKYEVPIGLAKKLIELSTFDALEFIIDDSGSMTEPTDSTDANGNPRTRKDEALSRLLEMVEVLSYIKLPPIRFRFLNHNNAQVCLELVRHGEKPKDYFERAKAEINKMWGQPAWRYRTPMCEALEKSFNEGIGKRISRYVFGDGVPNNPEVSIPKMQRMLMDRNGAKDNPTTFMSCTNVDADVEWMKTLEEKAAYCSESDDYSDELKEVRKDQGECFPYTKGFYVICELVAALNPNDLDLMDESIPFTKQTFDALQGYISTIEAFLKYFEGFLEAQRARSRLPNPTKEDHIKNAMDWRGLYSHLCKQEDVLSLPGVREYRERLKAA
jgi:hypothetical protein